jgi:alginate O-acetyltransferase complex protein AlgI
MVVRTICTVEGAYNGRGAVSMVFSSVIFLGVFLPLTLLIYYLSKNRVYRNAVMLVASLLFYAWGEPVYILAMIAVTLIDYVFGLLFGKTKSKAQGAWLLALCVVLNLIPLVTFKYYNFFAAQMGALFHFTPRLLSAALPIGISFFTFQSLSYAVDVYRKNAKTQRNYAYVLLYVSMFPQLIAGPIVRYADVEDELLNRRESAENFTQGCFRFAIGLAKKVILANYAGQVASYLLTDLFSSLSVCGAWIGVCTASLQLFFDFSGYSDIAIGLGMMFGFHFKENFRYPFIARSITEFWTRWHISMGNWFRDYVLYPLAMSGPFTKFSRSVRKRMGAQLGSFIPSAVATVITFVLIGLWHGGNWNYILWGLYFAVFLVIEKAFKMKRHNIDRIPVLSHFVTVLIVVLGFVLFYYTDLHQIGHFYAVLFGFGSGGFLPNVREMSQINGIFWLYPALIIAVMPWPSLLARKILGAGKLFVSVRAVWSAILIVFSFLMLLGQSFNPFIYFRF